MGCIQAATRSVAERIFSLFKPPTFSLGCLSAPTRPKELGKHMPQYAADEWNKFVLSKRLDSKYQTREQLTEFVHKGPKSLVKLSPSWKKEMAARKTAAKSQY